MNELALFAGGGGGILGGKLLGWSTVCAVEIESYAREVLLARQRDGQLPRFPIWEDVRTFDGRPWRGLVDIISGGFPCQDISCAGKGAGLEGERSGLWTEMYRIVCEVRPRWVFVENSPMLVSRGLSVVLGALAAAGYDAAWCVLGADDLGAPHVRKRLWLLAHDPDSDGMQCTEQGCEYKGPERHHGSGSEQLEAGREVEDAASYRLEAYGVQRGGSCAPASERAAAEFGGAGPHYLTCQDAKNNGSPSQQRRNTPPLNAVAGGALNPAWVEWLMGWPIGWTDLRPLGMDKFLSWRQQHLNYLNDI